MKNISTLLCTAPVKLTPTIDNNRHKPFILNYTMFNTFNTVAYTHKERNIFTVVAKYGIRYTIREVVAELVK